MMDYDKRERVRVGQMMDHDKMVMIIIVECRIIKF